MRQLAPISELCGTHWVPEPNTGCWLWLKYIDHNGYGRVSRGRFHNYAAHRLSWEQARGPIPDGLGIDHLCRCRSCVNPDHLEPVTNRVNARRGLKGMQATCLRGHPLVPENIYGTKWRRCATCNRDWVRRYRQKRKRAS